MLNAQMTINEIIAKSPRYHELLVKLGVDCCCGGNNTLEEEAKRAGLQAEDVLERLAFAGA